MSDSLKNPTPLSLAEKRKRIAQLLQEKARQPGTFPLSFAQQRLWFLDQLEPSSSFYNVTRGFWLKGQLHIDALEQGLNAIVQRHNVLRTTFVMRQDQPVQCVTPVAHNSLVVVDLTGLPEAERESETLRLATEEAHVPFDLTRDRPLRTFLLRLGQAKHLLLLTWHHIIADGWSMGVFMRELDMLYAAYRFAKPSPLLTLPIQYTDFAVWQRQWLQGEVLEEQVSYWKHQLDGAPMVLQLPTDRPRLALQTFRGAHAPVRFPKALTSALNDLSRQEGTTLFMTLLGAFQVLLARYSGQEDIVVGTPIANRTRSEVEGLIGFFANTLVLRTNLSGQPCFREVLRRVRKVALGAYANQDLPFEKLVEVLRPERSVSHTPLFQVMFSLEQASMETLALADVVVQPLFIETGVAKFDLTLSLVDSEKGIQGHFEYNTDLFDVSTIQRMIDNYLTLLEGIVAYPEQQITTLPLLSEAERELVLHEWNQTAVNLPEDLCVHTLFEARVEQQPDAIALVCEDQQLSYGELNRRANQLAYLLQERGVGPGVLVAYCIERSIEMAIGLLGILKAGGAYVPLDPSYPQERLAFILQHIQTPVLLTQRGLLEDIPASQLEVVFLDASRDVLAQHKTTNLVCTVQAQSPAYVLYTSGSTGRPKGVLVSHQALVNHNLFVCKKWGLQTYDCMLQFAALGFDVAAEEIFPTWLSGARVVLRPEQAVPVLTDFEQMIEQQGLTIVDIPTSYWHEWIVERGQATKPLPSSLRLVITGGEAASCEDMVAWQCLTGKQVHWCHAYGVTEATITTALYELTAGQSFPPTASVPLGRPVANTQVYVLDALLQPVPIGVPGELFIGGRGLALGYLHHPDLTAERFIPNPFSPDEGARLYQAGDRVRYLADGTIEFLGRLDYQVKLRGYRIELGEIEALLQQHKAIGQAIVVLNEDIPTQPQLIAYVVARQGETPLDSELQGFLKQRLPGYMIPSTFVLLETIPLTPNGKVDRQALPSPESSREAAYVAPRTPIEEILATIWADILGREQIGVHDNFFEVGGHSLLATQLVSRVRSAFHVALPLLSLFQAPTVAGLALEVARQRDNAESTGFSLPTIVPDPAQRHEPFLLTDLQQAYWIGQNDALEIGNVASHVYFEVEKSDLDLERLTLAWQRLIQRHEMLRAIILPDGQQYILPEVPPYQIEVLDLSNEEDTAVAAQLEAIRQRMSHQMLPTHMWPLFELRASRLDHQRVRLHMSSDALLGDAASWQIIDHELALLYQDLDAPLSSLELSFRDYVLAEETLKNSDVYRRSQEYWLSRLSSLPAAPDLPLAQKPSALMYPRFQRWHVRVEPETWLRLKSRAARRGLTPSGVVLSAFTEVLSAWSKTLQFTINLTIFNRLPLHPQVNDIVGDFTSLSLLAVDNSLGGTFEDRARRLQKQLWQDLDHRYFSGVQVLRELARSQGSVLGVRMPIVFSSTLTEDRSDRRRFLTKNLFYSITQTPQVWLDNQVSERGGALLCNWDAVADLFPPQLLDDMFDAYCHLLDGLANEEHLWQETTLSLLPPAQLERRMAIPVTEDQVSHELLHTLFVKHAARSPQQEAVVTSERILTYSELSLRSNQVGHHLRDLGAKPEMLVAVVMEKGWEQVVAVLGILQSGAAYVPLDPGLPQERLWYLLAHGQVSIVLTQSWLEGKLLWPENIQCICVDDTSLLEIDDSALDQVQGPRDLAYMIYTSGSTGMPKGVMIDHQGAVNTILDMNQRFGVTSSDRVLALSSLSFDLSVYDIFGTLAAGGTIILPEATAKHDPAHWARLLAEQSITIWNSVPALMEILVEYIAAHAYALPAVLRLVLLSGDWIPVTLPDQIRTMAPDAQVISLGGATEASIWSILYPIGQVDPAWQSIPYGWSMKNQWVHVLNEALEPCPTWVPGQLYIGGIGLARGYWRDEENTHASFIQHPRTQERLYRTGDLGHYLPDGTIIFLGREDFQVKVQGYRIELGEIETALLQFPEVRAAVVTATGKPQETRHLVAYVVPRQEQGTTADELRHFLQQKLPDYMVPSVYMVLDALPLTSNGKVDRKALPEPMSLASSQRNAREEDTAITTHITRLVANILKCDTLDPGMNLLELGANSIDMIRILNLLEKELNFRPDAGDFFSNPRVDGLVKAYEKHINPSILVDYDEGEL